VVDPAAAGLAAQVGPAEHPVVERPAALEHKPVRRPAAVLKGHKERRPAVPAVVPEVAGPEE
jgi:hypothetical protein